MRSALIAIFLGILVASCDASFALESVVTASEFRQIGSGMSYSQVTRIIGASGEEVSRNYMEGVPGVMESVDTVLYQWINADGSNMNAMFQNDELVQKAQFGLR